MLYHDNLLNVDKRYNLSIVYFESNICDKCRNVVRGCVD